jgi:hypothetical protein
MWEFSARAPAMFHVKHFLSAGEQPNIDAERGIGMPIILRRTAIDLLF